MGRADGEPLGTAGRCMPDPARGPAERVTALHMIEPHAERPRAVTLGAGMAYDVENLYALRSMRVTPHAAQNVSGRRSTIDGHTTRTAAILSAAQPQAHLGGLRLDEDRRWPGEDRFRGVRRFGFAFTFAAAAYNLLRLPKLPVEPGLWARCPAFAKTIAGRWRVVEMDNSGNAFLDLVEEAHIAFEGAAEGKCRSAPSRVHRCPLRRSRRAPCGVLVGGLRRE